MALNVNMGIGQYIIIRVTPDGKQYSAWVVEPSSVNGHIPMANGLPVEPLEALANRTTSASTLGTNIQNALPTLST